MKNKENIFEKVTKDLKKEHTLTPIKLIIGNKRFDGFEFPDNSDDDLNGFYNPTSYITWLIIKSTKRDIRFLDKDFNGKEFDIYGETHGEDFVFMGKSNKFNRSDLSDWTDEEWEEYINIPIEFELIYEK